MPSEQITVPSQRDTKVPGLMPPLKDKATHITDLAKYSVPELTELRDRQKHMLANKSILKVLSDKGQRIKSLYNRILAELENRDEMSKAVSNFSELNIAENGKEAIANMEWHGKLEAFVHTKPIVSNDDPDETDPLKLLAQSRHSTRIVTVEDASADDVVSLITAADLEEIRSFHPEPSVDTAVSDTLEPHALYMCSIERRHVNEVHRQKFLPHKTTTSDVHSVTQEKKRQLAGGKHWENTAATPPPLRNGEVIALTLQDSIANQRRQIDLVKSIEQSQAERRLLARSQLSAKVLAETYQSAVADNPDAFKTYRDVGSVHGDHDESAAEDEEDELESDDEVHDLYDEPNGGVSVVVYEK